MAFDELSVTVAHQFCRWMGCCCKSCVRKQIDFSDMFFYLELICTYDSAVCCEKHLEMFGCCLQVIFQGNAFFFCKQYPGCFLTSADENSTKHWMPGGHCSKCSKINLYNCCVTLRGFTILYFYWRTELCGLFTDKSKTALCTVFTNRWSTTCCRKKPKCFICVNV